MSRFLRLGLALLLLVGAAAGGWYAAGRTRTPAELAAEAEPPEASLITAPVELLEINTSVLIRGDVRFDEPETIVSTGTALEGVASVVTMVPEVGAEFTEGEVLFEVSGRPTFVFQGELPLFRDLRPGAEGEDVLQFQEALARIGREPGPIDGTYGIETQRAVDALYASAGYEAFGPSDQELATVEGFEDIVTQAQRSYNQANDERQKSLNAVRELDAARAAEVDAGIGLESARIRLAKAELGTHPDTGLPPTDEQLAQLETDLVLAQTVYDGALARFEQARIGVEVAGPARDISNELEALNDARADLAKARTAIGTVMPTAEIIFVGVLPIRVDSVDVARGDGGAGQIMSVSGSRLAIDTAIAIDEAESVEVGTVVEIEQARLGITLSGTVSFKADRTGTDGADADEYALEIVPDEVVPELSGTNVRISIPIRSTGGEVLAVPLSALSATAGGDAIVTVVADDGSTRTVVVEAGLASSGLVQINPIDGDIAEGDQVVVGLQ